MAELDSETLRQIREASKAVVRLETILPPIEKRLDAHATRLGSLSESRSRANGMMLVVGLIGMTIIAAFFSFGSSLARSAETIANKVRVVHMGIMPKPEPRRSTQFSRLENPD